MEVESHHFTCSPKYDTGVYMATLFGDDAQLGACENWDWNPMWTDLKLGIAEFEGWVAPKTTLKDEEKPRYRSTCTKEGEQEDEKDTIIAIWNNCSHPLTRVTNFGFI